MMFGLGPRLHVWMSTGLDNGFLHNGQQLGRAVNIKNGTFAVTHFCYRTLLHLAVYHKAFRQLWESF